MLQSLRRIQESYYLKFIVLLVVIAFLAISLPNIFIGKNDSNNPTVVNFKYSAPITRRDILLRQNIFGLSGKMEQVFITQMILPNLIREKLLLSVAKELGFFFDDYTTANFIKNNPFFQNEKKLFDKSKFDGTLRNLNLSEAIYLEEIRSLLTQDTINKIFSKAAYVPKVLTELLQSFYGTNKKTILIKTNKNSFIPSKNRLQKADLNDFFEKNKESFILPETRDISYCVIEDVFMEKYKNINKNSENSPQTLENYCKLIEEEIDYAQSLEQIAKKYQLKLISLKNQTAQNIKDHKELKNITEQIFETSLSLPEVLKTADNKNIIFSVDQITPSFLPSSIDLVIEKVREELSDQIAIQEMTKSLNRIYQQSKNKKDVLKLAKQNKMQIQEEIINVHSKNKFSDKVLEEIHSANAGDLLTPFITDTEGYIVYVEYIAPNKKLKQDIYKDIKYEVRNGYMHSLLLYLNDLNQIKINYEDPIIFPK